MELRNERGDIANVADNLTLKEITEMGFSIDICDESFDPSERWHASSEAHPQSAEFPED
ncbi:hypothetical protein [Vibrio sp. NTOU-M3]|uniref:hypothetical protein n=1 Tax=unclassified Vibrio TaxID=2614977 RepID=UPI00349F2708